MTISPHQLHRVVAFHSKPADREDCITSMGKVIAFFLAESEQAKARHRFTNCFTDLADMDAAALNAKAALRLMETLIKGRSPETVARLETERGLR